MRRPWRLTRQAETSLVDIARWTLETFGPRQAAVYEEELIERCVEIAEGSAVTRPCRHWVGPDPPEDLRVARSGRHYIVFIENATAVTVVDFLHVRSDLPRRLAALADSEFRHGR